MTRRSLAAQRVWYRAPLVAPCLLALTSCEQMIGIDPVTQVETPSTLCSVGEQNIWLDTRTVGVG